MAYIETISPSQASGSLAEAYRQIRRDMVGGLPLPLGSTAWNIMRVFSLRPAFLRAFENCFLLTMWGGPLCRRTKEAIGVTTAWANQCHY